MTKRDDDKRLPTGVPLTAIFAGGIAARNLAASGETRPKRALELAEKLRKSGASPATIHTETSRLLDGTPYSGVHYGVDGKPRFEIADDVAKVRPRGLDAAGRGYMGDFLAHDELYRAYPEAQLLGVEKSNMQGGGYDGQKVFVGDNHFSRSMLAGRQVPKDTAKGVALHELQHFAQEAEGFAPGASPSDFERRFPGPANADLRHRLYETTAGEAEAENTRARRNMTPAERRRIAPSRTETVARAEQHLGAAEGRTGMARQFGGALPKGYRVERHADSLGRNTYTIFKGKSQVGWAYIRDLPDRAQVGRITIEKAHQRKGIATALYAQIERDIGKPLTPDYTLSPLAASFWRKHRPQALKGYRDLGDGSLMIDPYEASRNNQPAASATSGERTGEVRRVQRMVDRPSAGRNRRESMAKDAGIGDLGEKIGGARKDTAGKTGPRKPKAKPEQVDTTPAWARRFKAMQELDRVTKRPSGTWSLVDVATGSRYGGRTIARGLASEAAAEAMIPYAAVARNHSVMSAPSGQEGYAIWRKVTDRKRVQIGSDVFPTRDAAMKWMAENAVKIIETKTGFGEEVLAPPKPDQLFRRGPAVRAGDIQGSEFVKTFGFRGVEFGNWNNQIERQRVMNHAYDALRDLSEATGLDPKAMSLDGKLGLAFGARGHGLHGARAHYERNYGAINLTKLKGAGSLAHEWMHALDHYLGRLDDPTLQEMVPEATGGKVFKEASRDNVFASHRVAGYERTKMLADTVRKAMTDVMETMYVKEVGFTEDQTKADKFADASKQRVGERLAAIRRHLAEPLPEYFKRNNKPASAAQLARFDELAAKILSGDDLATSYKASEKPRGRMAFSGRYTNDTLEGLSNLMKEVRGRSGFDSQNQRGDLDYLRTEMSHWQVRQKMLADAAAQTVKTKKVPTDYAMNAKRIDQGRVQDYWTTRHEMLARGFSSYVEDKIKAAGRESGFLSWGSDNALPTYRLLNVKPFPEGAERTAINARMDSLFSAMRQAGVLPAANSGGMTPADPAPTSGLRGTQNPANLAAIVANRAENARLDDIAAEMRLSNYPKTGTHDIDVRGVTTEYRADAVGDPYKFKSRTHQNIGYDDAGYPKAAIIHANTLAEYEAKVAAAQTAMRDGEASAAKVRAAAEAKAAPAAKAGPTPGTEIRASGKRFTVYENGEAIKDSKGADKWFGSREKAEKFLAGRAKTVTDVTSRSPSVTSAAEKTVADQGPSRKTVTSRAPIRDVSIGDNGGPSEQALKTAAKLEAVAKRTIEKAEQTIAQPRQMNTARRARLGSGVIEQAQQEIADAKTALKIAEALRQGEAGPLANVKSLADIRELRRLAREAEYATDRVLGRGYKTGGYGLQPDDVKNLGSASGFVRLEPSKVAELRAALSGKKGLASAFKTLERYADGTSRGGRTDFRTSDPAVFEAVRTIAKAAQTDAGLKHGIRYDLGRLMDEVREFDRAAKIAGTSAEGRQAALRAFLDVREGKVKANPVQVAEQALIGQKIPGFFPTPESLAKRMADLADIREGQTVLEPSAGTGRLAAAAAAKGAKVDAVEVVPRLQEILKLKGLNVVDSDFTAMVAKDAYDRILMNPPFEKGQDMAHVRKAYEMLKPGGKMVAIMGEGAFFRADSTASEFRSWLDQVKGTSEKLPEGTFKESNTGVNTRLVVIEKPAAVAEAAMKAATGERPGWSDAARAASAEARGVAQPGEAVAAAKKGDVKALAKALRTNETRAYDMLSRYRKGVVTDAHLTQIEARFATPAGKMQSMVDTPKFKDSTGLIGREWDSPYGRQRVARIIQHPTGDMVEVETVGSQAVRRYDASRIDETIASDTHRTTPAYQQELAERAEMLRLKEESRARQESAAAKLRDEVKGFTDSKKMSPMAAKKAENALLQQVRNNGNVVSTKALVEQRVADGMRVETITVGGKTKRVLAAPGEGGAFIELNKTALDYAEHVAALRGTQNPNNLAAINANRAANTDKPNTIPGKKRTVTLGDGRKMPLGKYVEAWKTAKGLAPETPVRGTPSDPIGGGTAGDVVRELRAGMQDRINRHDPQFGKGRRWSGDWQAAARRLADTVRMRSEVPAGQAHPVDLRPRLAAMGKLEEGTFVPKPGGDRSKARPVAVKPVAQWPDAEKYVVHGNGERSLSKGYIRAYEAEIRNLPATDPTRPLKLEHAKILAGTRWRADGTAYSPGLTKLMDDTLKADQAKAFAQTNRGKRAARKATPQVAPLKGMAPLGAKGGPIGFQNESTLNAALKAQGKAEAGKAKPSAVNAAARAAYVPSEHPKGKMATATTTVSIRALPSEDGKTNPYTIEEAHFVGRGDRGQREVGRVQQGKFATHEEAYAAMERGRSAKPEIAKPALAKAEKVKPPKLGKNAGLRFVGTDRTLERGPVNVYLTRQGLAVVGDIKAPLDVDGRPMGLRDAPSGIQLAAAKANKDHRFHASAQRATADSLSPHFKPAQPTLPDLKAEAKAAGIKGASRMSKAGLMEALGKTVNKIGAVSMVAVPAAAAYTAYHATKDAAHAAGQDGTKAAAASAVAAGGTAAAVGYGVMKGIGGAMKLAAKAAPKIAPALGPAGIALGVGFAAYGAYKGYQAHGLKGAALGAIGAETVLDVKPAPAGTARNMTPEQTTRFKEANDAFAAMKTAEASAPKQGWTDEARIAAYVARMSAEGKTPEHLPYGGSPRKGASSK